MGRGNGKVELLTVTIYHPRDNLGPVDLIFMGLVLEVYWQHRTKAQLAIALRARNAALCA